MKTTVQALKELYATLGGNLADVALIERIPEMIEALNSIAVAVPAPTAEDKGKVITVGDDGALDFANALPPVTSADAGKVLAVDEQGAWNPAEASGGGIVLKVLTRKQFKYSPLNTGWNERITNAYVEVPADFAALCPAWEFDNTLTADPMFYALRKCEIEEYEGRLNIRFDGSVFIYRDTPVEVTYNGYVDFFYYAKA